MRWSKVAWIVCALPAVLAAQTDILKIEKAPWFAREVADGVTWKYYHFDDLFGGQQDVHIAEIDMDVAGTALKFLYRPSVGATVATYATDHANTAATINGNFSNPAREIVQFLRLDGTLITPTWVDVQDEGGIVIDNSGFVDVVLRPSSGDWADRTEPNVMASNVPLLTDGALYPLPDIAFYMRDRHPRSAVGKTADNRLLLVAVDGRRAGAEGMTLDEMRTLFLGLGADDAQNLDGGGSTSLWIRGEPGDQVVNTPSDGSLRLVASALAVVANPSTATMDHDARYMGASAYQATMTSATTQTVTMTFRNYGTTAWGAGTVLKTTEDRNRASPFFTAGDWVSASSPGALNESSVAPGADGTFTFTLTAPAVSAATAFTESFGVYDAAGGWLGPEQNRLTLTVLPKGV
ncbi:MAG: hypothetical protein PWP23_1093 [Candidatus Sumerlaeota bacterium]|nr:hypothetical protein [Candidatus Sumerlaeota bacterium]